MFDPTQYGLTAELTTANLLNGIAAYKAAVEKLAGTATPTQQIESKMRETLLADKDLTAAADNLIGQVRDLIFSAPPDVFAHIFDSLQGISKDVKEVRDWHVAKLAKQNRVSVPVDATSSDLFDAARNLSEYVGNLFTFFSGDMGKNWPGYNAEEMAKVPVRETQRDGKGTGNFVLDVPRIPGTKKSGNGAGRGVEYRITRYCVDGETVPAGTHLRDVLHTYINDPRHIYTVTWVVEELKRTGTPMSAKPGQEWSVKFGNGKELVGWVPDDAEVDDDSEEVDDNQ